ncbi:DUF4283 domain-containing protein [Raphanus sativus]|nr:DUF4283 domain-containing protein [Raphanus sativus]
MENPWLSAARASALLPVPPPTGIKPIPDPPDPPDPPNPASSFPLALFPPLSTSPPKSQKQSKLGQSHLCPASKASNTQTGSALQQSSPSFSGVSNPNPRNPRSTSTVHEHPVVTDAEPAALAPAQEGSNIPVSVQDGPMPPFLQRQPTIPPAQKLVERIRKSEDKTLKRLAPINISDSGRPTAIEWRSTTILAPDLSLSVSLVTT